MSELAELAQRVAAQAAPGEQVEAYVVRSRDTAVRVYRGEVEQLESAQSEGVGVRVIRDGRQGVAYAGTLAPDAVAAALAEARDNATFGTPDEWAGLAEPDGVARAELSLWSDELASVSTDAKVAMAVELERLALAGDPRVTLRSAEYADVMAEGAVATSTGILAESRETGCYVSVSTMATEDGDTQSGFGFSVGRAPSELDVVTAAADGVQRAVRLLGARKPDSGRFTVVLDPFVTAQLLGIIGSTMNGESVLKGRSMFANRLGEQVAATSVNLVDDPTDPLAYSATAVDGEGLATRRNVLLLDGVLQQFVHNAYSARRAGLASTGNAVRGGFKGTPGVGCLALALVPGTASQPELIAGIDRGVLIQQVSGLHSGVNPVSGDFSTGAAGLRISGGTTAEPIKEFTIASTLQRMLLDVVAIGGDVERLPTSATGVSLVIDDVTVSGR